MSAFQATLLDDGGQALGEVQGTLDTEDGASGRFEMVDNDAFMQGIMEGKPFRLKTSDGEEHVIKVKSVATTAKAGTSAVEFISA